MRCRHGECVTELRVACESSPIAISGVVGGVDVNIVSLNSFDKHGDWMTVIAPVVASVRGIKRSFIIRGVQCDGASDNSEQFGWVLSVGTEGNVVE